MRYVGSRCMIALLFLGTGAAPAQERTKVDAFGDPLPAGAIARLGTTRFRPGGGIARLVFSPDGKRLACWSAAGLSVYEAATGRELRHVALTQARALALTWLKDGRGLAVLGLGDGSFYVWEFTNAGDDPPRVPWPTGGIFNATLDYECFGAFAVSPDGKHLAAGRRGQLRKARTIDLLELVPGKQVGELQVLRTFGPQPGNCIGLAFTPDNRSLLAFSQEHLVLYDPATGKPRLRRTVPASDLRFPPGGAGLPYGHNHARGMPFALADDGRALALGAFDGTARVWDLVNGQETRSVARHVEEVAGTVKDKGVNAVAFGAGGRTLITSGRDARTCVWDADTGQKIRELGRNPEWNHAVAVSPDGKRIATGGIKGQVRLWDADTGADLCPAADYPTVGWPTAVAPDGKVVASLGENGKVCLWELASGRVLRRLDRANVPTSHLSFTPDGKALLAGGWAGKTHLLDAGTGKPLALPEALAADGGSVLGLSRDHRTLITTHGRTVALWDWPAGRPRRKFEVSDARPQADQPTQCQSADLSDDGRRLLTVSYQALAPFSRASLELWDATTGRRLRHLNFTDPSWLPRPLLSPDGSSLVMIGGVASSSSDVPGDRRPLEGVISLWDAATFTKRRDFAPPPWVVAAPNGRIGSVTFSPDGRVLAVVEQNQPIVLYEVATGQVRCQLAGHRNWVQALAFTRDGRHLVSTSSDRTGLVWDVIPAAAGQPFDPANAEAKDQLWRDLAAPKAETAYRALSRLAAVPDAAVALLKERLKPSAYPDDAALDRLVTDLDAKAFAVRERATAELDRLGSAVVSGVLVRLKKAESLELRRRLELFLNKHYRGVASAERLREGRAVELLEQIGTEEARAVLRDLAKGSSVVRLTQDAAAALRRLRD